MSTTNNYDASAIQNENDIDSLLDDALEDFNRPLPSLASQKPNNTTSCASARGVPAGSILTEEMIKEATQNFEASMRAIMVQQQKVAQTQQLQGSSGSVLQTPTSTAQVDLQSLTAQFAQFADSATNVANNTGVSSEDSSTGDSRPLASEDDQATSPQEIPDFQKLLTDAIQQMAKNNQAFQSAPSAEELSHMMSGLGLGGGDQDGEGAGGLMSLMQSMLENVLSKEIIYPPIKEIVDKYPDWLADNRSTVDAADFDRYSRQFDVMKKIVNLFDSESESDSDEVKAKGFEDLVGLMQKLQEQGHPPPELAGEVPPHLSNLTSGDPGNPEAALPDLSAAMGSLAAALGDPTKAPNANEEQCCLM